MENRIKHLELIQQIIARMALNSFSLKGWSVVLVSALFALSASNSNQKFIYLAYFPAMAFWILDGYFLRQERLFRKLYNKVTSTDEKDINFSMDVHTLESDVNGWLKTCLSKTLVVYHGAVFFAILLVIIIS